jgi:phosphoglycerate dehydrogenase-like enzyme
VGLGGIGVAVAQRALPFGMRVLALRRTGRKSPIEGVELAKSLGDLLESSDHLVLALPATPKTRHLIGAAALARIKPGAHLINIARGSLVDQEALREALASERVALASLDVTDPEPLPAGHWLYEHPKVRLSPHVSWSMPGAVSRLLDTFVDNLHRYREGAPLDGRVDLDEGY